MTTPTTPEELAAPLAVEMTIITGELWRTDTTERATLIYSASACLSLSEPWNKRGRVRVHATAPHGMKEKTNGESITCTILRGPEAIARDLIARILPHARAHLIESMQYDNQRRHEEAAAHLRKSMMKQFTEEEYNGKLYKRSKDRNRRMWIDVNNYDNTATIEIHLPFADAIKLLKQIRNGEYIK